jgi:AraC family transcriptional regulator
MPPLDTPDKAPLRRIETSWSAGRIPLQITQFDLPPHEDPDPVSDNFILCLALRGTVRAAFQLGDGWRHALVPPGSFMPITPPHTLGELVIDAPHRHLMLALPMTAVAEIDGSQEAFGPLHEDAFQDKLVAQLCMGLWEEARFANPSGDLFADCTRAALVAALRRRARQRPAPVQKILGFCPKTWARIENEIDVRLGEPLTVEMLAALSGMRETRFLRAFKMKTGQSPYRYVLQKRLDRALASLADPKLTLVQVALSTGFSDQAHMTMTFTRLLGRTPGDIRRSMH